MYQNIGRHLCGRRYYFASDFVLSCWLAAIAERAQNVVRSGAVLRMYSQFTAKQDEVAPHRLLQFMLIGEITPRHTISLRY
jgi:hypothetical protein